MIFQLWILTVIVCWGAQGLARAANAANPYVDVDPRVDAGNATGDEQVERLNRGQLGLSDSYREDGWWHGGPTTPPPPGGWWDRGDGEASGEPPPPPRRRRMKYGYGAPPGYYLEPGYAVPRGYYFGPPPGYYPPPSVSIY